MTNGEYRDCEHCAKTYGTLGCCDTVSNEWVYSCKEGHEEYARGMRKFGLTTKNDLGVDAVSRKDVHDMLENLPVTVEDKWFNWLQKACMRLAELPSVTPQEPKTKIEESNFSQEQYLADIQSAYDCGKSVIDKIRKEIKEWYWQADKQALAKDPCVVDSMIDLFIRTIDKYKAEVEPQESEDKE